MLLVQNQIAEEGFQELRCGKDAFGYVVVVGAHQRIAKVPRIIGKGFVALMSKPNVRRYLMVKTAVVRVLPSPNG